MHCELGLVHVTATGVCDLHYCSLVRLFLGARSRVGRSTSGCCLLLDLVGQRVNLEAVQPTRGGEAFASLPFTIGSSDEVVLD